MKRLWILKLKRALGLCSHKWKIHKEGGIVENDIVVGNYYDLKCSKCGDLKRRRFKE